MTDEKAAEYIELAQSKGWQLLTHVNGDAAIDQLLKGIEASEKNTASQIGALSPSMHKRHARIRSRALNALGFSHLLPNAHLLLG